MAGSIWSLQSRLRNESDFIRALINKIKCDIRCAAPGIIKKFDVAKQTVDVQLVTREKFADQGQMKSFKIPELGDVPICMPRAGNFIITMPIEVGDECLVVFADTCIDDWFQRGGEENEQITGIRHDLSDAIAICGIWNQKRVIDSYSTDSVQIRNENGDNYIELKDDEVNIKTTSKINIETSGDTKIDATGSMDITSSGAMSIESESTVDISGTGNVNIEGQATLTVKSTGVLNVESSGIATVKGTTVNVDAPIVNIGGLGGQAVARIGDDVNVLTGKIISGSSKVFSG